METRKLGRTGIRVSEIGLGTWPVGGSLQLGGVPTGYGNVPESEAVKGIERALERGVNFFDTADTYGLGRAERILAGALSGRRAQAVIATKAGWVPDGSERWIADLSRHHLLAAAERSRERLSAEALDIFLLHAVPQPGPATEEALDALDELKTQEIVRVAGASVGPDVEAGRRLLRTRRLDVIEVQFNLLNQAAADDLLDEAHAAEVGVIASTPLAHGFLSGRYTRATKFAPDDWRSQLSPQEIAATAERVTEFAFLTGEGRRSGMHAALQFVLNHPAVSAAIPGFRNLEQVDDLLDAPQARPLTDIEIARAREVWRSRPVAADA